MLKADESFLYMQKMLSKSIKLSGPHPAGNVGVQIHHIAPINKGESIWTLKPQDIITDWKSFLKLESLTLASSNCGCYAGSQVKGT